MRTVGIICPDISQRNGVQWLTWSSHWWAFTATCVPRGLVNTKTSPGTAPSGLEKPQNTHIRFFSNYLQQPLASAIQNQEWKWLIKLSVSKSASAHLQNYVVHGRRFVQKCTPFELLRDQQIICGWTGQLQGVIVCVCVTVWMWSGCFWKREAASQRTFSE